MTKYRELQKLVYSIIFPEGIPIDIGVEVYNETIYKSFGMVVATQTYKFEESTCDVWWDYGQGSRQPVTFLKILGKPLQGFDILRAVKLKAKLEDYETIDLSIYGVLVKNTWFRCELQNKEDLAKIDLTTPIKDYPDETLQKLINLIK